MLTNFPHEKTAAWMTPTRGQSTTGALVGRAATGALMGIGLAMLVKKLYTQIQNDQRRKTMLEDLHLNDPMIKTISKDQLLEWYATIMHFAPKTSLDKNAVREIIQGFIRFGKVDLNTLNMLAKTEEALAKAESYSKGYGGVLDTLSSAVGIGTGVGKL